MKKLLIIALFLVLVPLCTIFAFNYMKDTYIYLEPGAHGSDVVVIKSFLGINPVDENFDSSLTQKIMDWQNKYNATNNTNTIHADGKIRKETLQRMNLSVNDNYEQIFKFSIIQNSQYTTLLENAYSLGYKGYVDIIEMVQKRIPKAVIKLNGSCLTLYNIPVTISGIKMIHQKAYANPTDIDKALYNQTDDPAKSYLLRIFPEEKHYQQYINYTADLLKTKYKVDNLDTVFLRRIAAFLRDNNKTIIFAEGFRKYEDQDKLYKKAPERAVPPGTSWHEYSVAVDVYDSKLVGCKWLKGLYNVIPTDSQTELLKYGLFKPYTVGNKSELLQNSFPFDDTVMAEDWHLQPIETRYDPNQANYQIK